VPIPPSSNNNLLNSIDSVDWAMIVSTKPNVLVCGDQSFTDALLVALLPHCRLPIQSLPGQVGTSVPLPEGTVLLPDVASYDKTKQQGLLAWLENEGSSVQVISTTERPVFDLVERGEFLARLFYHLNVVYLDLGYGSDDAES
jgi:sigma-54-interacting transcriptional regulator